MKLGVSIVKVLSSRQDTFFCLFCPWLRRTIVHRIKSFTALHLWLMTWWWWWWFWWARWWLWWAEWCPPPLAPPPLPPPPPPCPLAPPCCCCCCCLWLFFLLFILLFWNHILICLSVRLRFLASSHRFCLDTYALKRNSFSSSSVWNLE